MVDCNETRSKCEFQNENTIANTQDEHDFDGSQLSTVTPTPTPTNTDNVIPTPRSTSFDFIDLFVI